MITESQRNYEVSIWTLQDSFITVLKPTNLEFKGQIQDPDMILKDDGTLNFSFSIPMYIRSFPIPNDKQEAKGELIENPIWYTTQNGVIAASMRKIKVIFDKFNDPTIFEFLITKVTETHEKGQLTCKIESEGLAFHELGHQGVIISLSSDDYLNDYNEWVDNNGAEEPINNINYWTEKALKFTNWTYEVQMDYSGFINRNSNKIYEDAYVANWKLNDNEDKLIAERIEDATEKLRMIDISDSNLYNITQKIAETFEVYCKYKYEYDSSFHIINRKIIYYNSFIQDAAGALDITYPYDTDKITRTMDGTDICTKLYVKKVEDDNAPTGYISIMSTAANPSGEDYILNFDYLHKIGTITDEQYAEIKPYEISMRKLNTRMTELSELIADAEIKLVEYTATIKTADDSIIKCTEQLNNNIDLCASITDDTGFIHLTKNTAAHGTLVPDANTKDQIYKINISTKGVVNDVAVTYKDDEGNLHTPSSNAFVKIFESVNDIGDITPYSVEANPNYKKVEGSLYFITDDMGNITGIGGFTPTDGEDYTHNYTRYLIYSYSPKLYYENINAKLENRIAQDSTARQKAEDDYNKLNSKLIIWREELKNLLAEKEQKIRRFNIMMGPALREGQWNPEEYKDYGVKKETSVSSTSTQISPFTLPEVDNNKEVNFIWDTQPFDGETLQYYQLGINTEINSYPYILLSETAEAGKISIKELQTRDLLDKLTFFYNTFDNRDDMWQAIHINGTMQYAFKKHTDGKYYAIILFTDMNQNIANTINNIQDSSKKFFGVYGAELAKMSDSRSGILDADMLTTRIKLFDAEIIQTNNSYSTTNNLPDFDDDGHPIFTYPMVYPRIEINSLSLKTSADVLKLSYQSDQFYFKFKYLYVYHNKNGVYVKCQLYSNQDATGITIYPSYTHHDDFSHGTWSAAGNEPWANWAAGVGGETGYRLRFDGDDYCLRRRTFDIELRAKRNNKVVCTRIVTVNLPKQDNGYFTYEEDITSNLDMYSDYTVLIRDNKYYLSIKPQIILKYLATGYNLKYELSNADLHIYLDAKEVSKVNAYPQASYDVAVSLFGRKIDFKTYNLIGQIVNINDLDLKFEHVQGYISEVDLKLDKPWEDSIKIQNYKNKFEDLFSTIIASSNIVQAKAGIYDRTVGLFDSDGTLKEEVIKTTLGKVDLQYAFNKGKLTISEENGIWATSEDGVVAMSGGGIFTATEKDANGNWLWNTGIIPSGINASLINSGQLDTNLVRIFAGDNLRFQMNGDGLFAYRSRNDGSPRLNQYVVHNSEGLFLRGPKNQNETSTNLINRVAIDWAGLTLKNWNGNTTFFADADTGDLWLSGTVSAQNFKIVNTDEQWREGVGGVSLDTYTAQLLTQRGTLVQETLKTYFDKAGEVLSAAMDSQLHLDEILGSSAGVLEGFAEHLPTMTTHHYDNSRVWNFKVGDTWTVNGKTYVASVSWDKIYSDETVAKTNITSFDGWVLVNSEYKYAAISGTGIDIDANSGVITLKAGNNNAGTINLNANQTINLSSGKAINLNTEGIINLTGSHVDIIGNKSVRIGGAKIYLAAGDNSGGEIHFTTASYTEDHPVSTVDLTSNGINIASGAKISIVSTGTNGIEIGSSASNVNNLIRLNSAEGIWIGSSAGITLYSGANVVDTAAAVEIKYNRILFGVGSSSVSAGTGTNTVVEITKDYLIIGTGNQYNNLKTAGAISPISSTAGVKIMPDSISFATGSGSARSYIGMSSNGIEIYHGTSSEQQDGSYIKLLTSGVSIGSSMSFDVNSSNIQIFSEGVTETINGSQSPNTYFVLGSNLISENRQPKLWFANGVLNVNGAITATSLTIQSLGTIADAAKTALKSSLGYQSSTDVQGALTTALGSYITRTALDETLTSYAQSSVLDSYALLSQANHTYYQDTEPNSSSNPKPRKGDLWVKTNSNNELKYYDGTSWVQNYATKIYNGTLGFNMNPGTGANAITSAVLNSAVGLKITDSAGNYFQVNNTKMGFYSSSISNWALSFSRDSGLYINGSGTFTGTVWASGGYIGSVDGNGWTIKGYNSTNNIPAAIYNGLNSFTAAPANGTTGGIYIGTDGISVNNLIKLSNSGIFTIYRGLTNSEEDREPVFSVSRDSTDSSKFNITFGKGVSFGDFILPEWNGGTGARTLTNNGIYKANSKNSLPLDAVNGSLGIVYQNEIATASGTLTATMDLTNTSPTFAKVRSSTNTWYNLTRYWNHGMLNVSDDKTYQGAIVGDNTNLDRYARVGYGTNSNYQSAICVLVKFRTDGINFNKINISFDWCTHPGTTFTSPPFDRQTKVTGSLKVKLYKENTDYSTTPFIFTPNINGDNAVRVSSGTIQSQVLNLTTPISNTTVANYYLVFYTTDPYSLIFIKPSSIKVDSITASGSTNTAELYIRSANQWVKVAQPIT